MSPKTNLLKFQQTKTLKSPSKTFNRELIITADGSHTFFVNDLNEHYHSVHGAIQESQHVFIQNGFLFQLKKSNPVHILEVGFGTGLNALLTLFAARNVQVKYTAIEPFPITKEEIKKLNFVERSNANLKEFYLFHESEWEKSITIKENFVLQKFQTTIQQISLVQQFDLVYFDAFGPKIQPEMWSEAVFTKIYEAMNNNGTLITYCASGSVKRALKSSGLIVEPLPGPPGKREITRALKV